MQNSGMTWAKKSLALVALSAVICGALVGGWAHRRRSESKRVSDRLALSRTRAEQGDVPAELQLASMCYYGRGVPQDYTEAVRWYRKAADQGDAKAEAALGYMYYSGQGVGRDETQSGLWYRQAAYAEARHALASFTDATRWAHEVAMLGTLRGVSCRFLVFARFPIA
jgi:TPR repeat protein